MATPEHIAQVVPIVFAAAGLAVGYHFRGRIPGISWRLAELLGGDLGKSWAHGIRSRELRLWVRSAYVVAYTTSTPSELLEELPRVLAHPDVARFLDPGHRWRGRNRGRAIFARWFAYLVLARPAGLTVCATATVVLAYASATTTSVFAADPVPGIGQLGPIPVLAFVILAIAGPNEDGRDGLTTRTGASQGMVRLAVLTTAVLTAGAGLSHEGWSAGSPVAHDIGTVSALITFVAAASPRRWWTAPGFRGSFAASGLLAGWVLAAVATGVEIVTGHFSPVTALASVAASASLGATALILACCIKKVPGSDDTDKVVVGPGPGDRPHDPS